MKRSGLYETTVDFFVGVGDAASFGLTAEGRRPGLIDTGSLSYRAGSFVGGGAVAFVGGEIGYGVGKLATVLRVAVGIETSYGLASQGSSEAALNARTAIENGASVYRQGSFGIQETGNAQFWATENPVSASNYAGKYGMPGGGGADWVMKAKINSDFVTRAAPGFGSNAGGAIEAVTNPGDAQIQWFYMH